MKNFFTSVLVAFTIFLGACQPHAMSRDASKVANSDELFGIWVVETISERPVIDGSPARIQFGTDGAINGNASCNRFFGDYTYEDGRLTINPLGSTRMMCLPTLMEQETRLLEFLPTASSASIENGVLILRDAKGRLIIQASVEDTNDNNP